MQLQPHSKVLNRVHNDRNTPIRRRPSEPTISHRAVQRTTSAASIGGSKKKSRGPQSNEPRKRSMSNKSAILLRNDFMQADQRISDMRSTRNDNSDKKLSQISDSKSQVLFPSQTPLDHPPATPQSGNQRASKYLEEFQKSTSKQKPRAVKNNIFKRKNSIPNPQKKLEAKDLAPPSLSVTPISKKTRSILSLPNNLFEQVQMKRVVKV